MNVGELRIDVDRLLARLDVLAEIGRVDGPNGEWGTTRLALTDEDRAARDLVATWMRDLGMEVRLDGIGNIVGRRAGRDADAAAVMTGSHIDTVRRGGRFDGNLGVLAGLEVAETLDRHGVVTERPFEVAVFTDEEGARFPPDMLGSLVYVGGMALEEALDIVGLDGARLGDELERIGYAGPTPCPTDRPPHAFIELHIEQGPILENEGTDIGVVEGVQGISWAEYTITGRSAHAGTTPMHLRRDAGYAAAVVTTFVRDLCREMGGSQVATVGRVELTPDLVNVIPGRAMITVDLRNTDERRLQEAERRLAAFLDELAGVEEIDIERRPLARFEPVVFDADMVDLVESTAERLGYRTRRMPSGAGHDAQMLARVCPSAMIFTPSVGGLSHNIAELTERGDLEAGANVLLQVLLDRLGVSR